MTENHDPMGRAIAEFHETGRAARLRVFSPMFDEDEIPVHTLFRTFESMPPLEQRALCLARGRTLDVGAGAGCHTLALQERGLDVTAIDISPLAVKTMKSRGVEKAIERNFFDLDATGPFDTIIMLMNGIGIAGTLSKLPLLFDQLDKLMATGGQLLCDSTDLSYLFDSDDEKPHNQYYGELSYTMQYRHTMGRPFNWLYIDFDTLSTVARQQGFKAELIAKGPHFDYLARIVRP